MQRIRYFDGVRGVACMMVVLYHYAGAFAPLAPLGFFKNGQSAVSLFFLMSGFVLTLSFTASPNRIIGIAGSRVLRLMLPAFASVIMAIILYRVLSQDIRVTMVSTGMVFFEQFTFALWHAPVAAVSLNPPLWTMSTEIWGSFLILALVWLRHKSAPIHIIVTICLLAGLGTNQLFLFIVGHFLANHTRNGAHSVLIGLLLISAGVWLCSSSISLPAFMAYRLLHIPSYIDPVIELGSILIILGIILLPALQHVFELRIPRYLGKISFSVYLLHFPIMATLGATVFKAFGDSGSDAAAACALCAGLATTLPAAALFEKYCDRPAIYIAQRLKQYPKTGSVSAGFNAHSVIIASETS